jgi:hypothetical protein
MLLLALSFAHAADPALRLLLVGDTGEETAVSAVVAADLARALAASPVAQVVALGDLYYDHVPAEAPDCAALVAARYRAFYGGFPAGRVHAVAGNHDVTDPEQQVALPAAYACTEAAFRAMGWLGADEPLATRTRAIDGGGLKVDLVLVEGGFYDDAHPALPDLRPEADWQLLATHYVLAGAFGKPADEVGAYFGVPRGHTPDLWVNGHAHHIEGREAGDTFGVTSGVGMEMRRFKGWVDRSYPSTFAWVRCPEEAWSACRAGARRGDYPRGLLPYEAEVGGYVVLDLLPPRQGRYEAVLTPVLCVDGACGARPSTRCVRREGQRGVVCS